MAIISKFEDLEVWKLAFQQTKDFDLLVEETTLSKNFELRNQMDASSGYVMDCIAEGFDRSGNSEFKNMLVIAKGSNFEFRSQLYRCLNRKHITQERFDLLCERNILLGNKIMAFIIYLQKTTFRGQRYKSGDTLQAQTSNIKPQT